MFRSSRATKKDGKVNDDIDLGLIVAVFQSSSDSVKAVPSDTAKPEDVQGLEAQNALNQLDAKFSPPVSLTGSSEIIAATPSSELKDVDLGTSLPIEAAQVSSCIESVRNMCRML
jgi:hypothetical protein